MLKSMSIHERDSKRIVRPNFVISRHSFRGLIPTIIRATKKMLTKHFDMKDMGITIMAF